jgi:hypothetical protein
MFGRTLLSALLCASLHAAVTKVDIASRTDLATHNYETITGKIHFAVDPKLPANKIITDIELAPRNAQGLVEFSADRLRHATQGSRQIERHRVARNLESRRARTHRACSISRAGAGALRMQAIQCCSRWGSRWCGSAGNGTSPRATICSNSTLP